MAGLEAPPRHKERHSHPKYGQPFWGEALLTLSGVPLAAKGFQPSCGQSALLRTKIDLVAVMGGFQKCPKKVL